MIVKLTGPFTEDDLKEIAKTLRAIERKNPAETFLMFLETPDMTLKQAKELVEKVFGGIKLREAG
jgi:hypothetical protein